jgi:site-specific DNA-adenine methylase
MPNSKTHFIFKYKGNKRLETSTILPIINFNNKKNIIEPFCGTSAMSFAIWQQYGNQFNYYLNDIDEKLIEVYNLLKNETIQNIEDNVNEVRCYVNSQEDKKNTFITIGKNNRTIYDYIYINKYGKFGILLFPIDTEKSHDGKNLLRPFNITPLQQEFIEFIKSPNVFISNNDYKIIYEEHRNNPKSIILLDPPYVNTDKSFYQSNDNEIYSYFTNNPIKKNKASTYVIVDDNWIMRIVFKDCNILSVYDKKYQIVHKKVKHIIFSNKSTPPSYQKELID